MGGFFHQRRLHNDGLSTISDLWQGPIARMSFAEPGPNTPLHPRIPAGTYDITLRAAGDTWRKFMEVPELADVIRDGLPHLFVPGRKWILIHPGNTIHDTEGCILPGRASVDPAHSGSGHWEVTGSRDAFRQLYGLMKAAMKTGAQWKITDEGGA